MQIGRAISKTLRSRTLKLERIFHGKWEHSRLHLTQSYDTDKAHYVITVWRKKQKVAFEQLQTDNKKTQYKSNYTLSKRFLRYNKALNYFKAKNKLYRHD